MSIVGFSGQAGAEPADGQAEPDQARAPDEDHRPGVPAIPHPRAGGLAAAGFGGFFTALAGRVRELYAQAGAAQEPSGVPE
jgi:hypothetical protein